MKLPDVKALPGVLDQSLVRPWKLFAFADHGKKTESRYKIQLLESLLSGAKLLLQHEKLDNDARTRWGNDTNLGTIFGLKATEVSSKDLTEKLPNVRCAAVEEFTEMAAEIFSVDTPLHIEAAKRELSDLLQSPYNDASGAPPLKFVVHGGGERPWHHDLASEVPLKTFLETWKKCPPNFPGGFEQKAWNAEDLHFQVQDAGCEARQWHAR